MGRYPTGWLIAALVFVVPDNATAQAVNTFANGEPILINDTAPATPYPSTIAVSGLTGAVVKVRVTLHNLTHAFGADISAWLVAPNGRTMLLLGRAPGANLTNVTLSLDDCAPRSVDATFSESPVGSGRYRPVPG